MPMFDLSAVLEAQPKKKQFPELLSISIEDAQHLKEHPELLGGKYLSTKDIESLPNNFLTNEEGEWTVKYFSCISDIYPDAQPFIYEGEVIGDQVYFFLPGLFCVSEYSNMTSLNSKLQSIKTVLSLMGASGHIHTSCFRVRQGKVWGMQYHFIFTCKPLAHSEVFGYGGKGAGQDGGEDAGQDGGEQGGGEGGGEATNNAPPM